MFLTDFYYAQAVLLTNKEDYDDDCNLIQTSCDCSIDNGTNYGIIATDSWTFTRENEDSLILKTRL